MEFNRYSHKKIDTSINKCGECNACCKDMIMKIGSLKRKVVYPSAIRSSFYDAAYISETCENGTYFIETNESMHTGFDTFDQVVINGKCPHLKENGDCGIYTNRPEACAGFKKDSKACLEKRTEEGFVSIGEIN